MNIGLRVNSSPKNQIGKDLGEATIYGCAVKDETDIIHPEFLLQGSIADIREFNYATVGQWKRHYFIDRIESVRKDLVKVYCSVDVLESWKTEILKNKALVKRQAVNYNKWINDGSMHQYANTVVMQKTFTNGFVMDTSPTFVLTVAGG